MFEAPHDPTMVPAPSEEPIPPPPEPSAQPPRRRRGVLIAGGVAVALVAGGLAFALTRGGGGGSNASIRLPEGTVTVQSAKEIKGDTWPEGCITSSASCYQVVAGHKFVEVTVRVEGKETKGKAYIVGSDGVHSTASIFSLSVGKKENTTTFVFTPASSAHGFKLVWPGGDAPFDLGI